MTRGEIQGVLQTFAGTKVLVIGDVMLDRYLRGRVERKSPEADVSILDHENTTTKLGGAANVAMNFKAMGCEVSILATTGMDEGHKEMQELLSSEGCHHQLIPCNDRPTTIKTRVIARNEHLLRVDFESTLPIDSEATHQVKEAFNSALSTFQPEIVILQDYNKGLLTSEIIKYVVDKCSAKAIFVAVDPKKDNFWEYKNVTLFKPNLRETEEAFAESFSTLSARIEASHRLHEQLNCQFTALTLGGDGLILNDGNDAVHRVAAPIEVIDVCGAGDAVLTIMSLMLFKKYAMADVAEMANIVGGKVCQISGVAVVGLSDF